MQPAEPREHVFVSYASRDGAIAEAVREALEAAGMRCWIAPRDIAPGTNYAAGIIDAIHKSSLFVLIFSHASNRSQHVQSEVERAFSGKVPIMAFRIDGPRLSREMEYFLSQSQWLPAETGDARAHIPALVSAVAKLRALSATHLLACPQCGKQLQFTGRHGGLAVRCLACKTRLVVSSDVTSLSLAPPDAVVAHATPTTALEPPLADEAQPRCPLMVGFLGAAQIIAVCVSSLILLFLGLRDGPTEKSVWEGLVVPFLVVGALLVFAIGYVNGKRLCYFGCHFLSGLVLLYWAPTFLDSWIRAATPLLSLDHVAGAATLFLAAYHLAPGVAAYFRGRATSRRAHFKSRWFWLPFGLLTISALFGFTPLRDADIVSRLGAWPKEQWAILAQRFELPVAPSVEVHNLSSRDARFISRYADDTDGKRHEFAAEIRVLKPGETLILTLWPETIGVARYGYAIQTASGMRNYYKNAEGDSTKMVVQITDGSFAPARTKTK